MESLVDQVEDDVRRVGAALGNAIGELEGRWLQTDAVEASLSALRSLQGPIDGWASIGRKGATTGKPPGAGGWPGWTKAGDYHLQGITEIQGLATSETLGNIEATAAGVKDDSVKIAKKVARTAEDATRRAAAVVGDAAGTIAAPLALPLALGAAGLVAAAVIFLKVKP